MKEPAITRVENFEMHKVTTWKCDRCDKTFRYPREAEDHTVLVHDAPVTERASPLGPIVLLSREDQVQAWLRAQPADCDIDYREPGWYACEVSDDPDRACYQAIDHVIADVSRRLADLNKYAKALRAVPRAKP